MEVDLRLIMVTLIPSPVEIDAHTVLGIQFKDKLLFYLNCFQRGLMAPAEMHRAINRASTKKVYRYLSPVSFLLTIVPLEGAGCAPPGQGGVPGQPDGARRHAALPLYDQVQLVQRHEGTYLFLD